MAEGNPKYYSQDNCVIERSTKTLVLGCNASIIPSDGSVIYIGESAFNGSGIVEIVIPEGIKTIGILAFNSCSQLINVTIPKSLKSINELGFSSCDLLVKYNYKGTKSEWAAISKELNWYGSVLQ